MAWTLGNQELQAVLKLGGEKRYEYFVKKVADEGRLWSLRGVAGWMLIGADDGREAVPVWPHEQYALLCATGDWSSYTAQSIDLDGWLARWIPGLKKDNRLVAVFPTPDRVGVPVEPERMASDLTEELSQYD